MPRGGISGKTLFAAVIFVASVVVLAFKFLNPTPVQILVEGDTVIMSQVPGLFTYSDVFVLAIALILMSVSGTYLLLHDLINVEGPVYTNSAASVIVEERRQRWEEIAKTLKNDEQILYKAIIDEGIINQSVLVEKTGLPKSNVSRALYGLESRGLIERRRRGMGNVVLLK
jgi:GTP-sensing pleiotropic transcriptional regulator CodY